MAPLPPAGEALRAAIEGARSMSTASLVHNCLHPAVRAGGRSLPAPAGPQTVT